MIHEGKIQKTKKDQSRSQETWGQGITLPWAFRATEEVSQNSHMESKNFTLLIFKVFVKVEMEMTNV